MGRVLAGFLEGWHPGTAEMTRRVDPWAAEAFAGLIGTPPPGPGDPLPPMWHWFTLLDHPAQSEIGVDGHPASGPFMPPIPGRRRMFAGGRLRLDAPIPIGAELSSRSAVVGISTKSGRSGELAFVTVRHELSVGGTAVGVEEQDIVYRSEPDGSGHRDPTAEGSGRPLPASPPETDETNETDGGPWRAELVTGPVLLFRFSALTYNGHRIHYDQPYATQVEGYPELVVHGPLLALLALELPRLNAPDRAVRAFDYRLRRPVFVPSRVVAVGRPGGPTVEVAVAAEGAAPSLTGTIGLG